MDQAGREYSFAAVREALGPGESTLTILQMYQGQYNPVGRAGEKDLILVLKSTASPSSRTRKLLAESIEALSLLLKLLQSFWGRALLGPKPGRA